MSNILYSAVEDDVLKLNQDNMIHADVHMAGGITGQMTYYIQQNNMLIMLTRDMMESIMKQWTNDQYLDSQDNY